MTLGMFVRLVPKRQWYKSSWILTGGWKRMDSLEDCIARCNKLIGLMEDERSELRHVLQGELYDAYESVLEDHIYKVKSIKSELERL